MERKASGTKGKESGRLRQQTDRKWRWWARWCRNGAGLTPSFSPSGARNESDGSLNNNSPGTFGGGRDRRRVNNPLSGGIIYGLVARLEDQRGSLARNARVVTPLAQAHVWGSQGFTTLDEARNKLFLARGTLILTFSGGRDESRGNCRIGSRIGTPRRLPSSDQAADSDGLIRGVQKIVGTKQEPRNG
jgi:hypothetical protein